MGFRRLRLYLQMMKNFTEKVHFHVGMMLDFWLLLMRTTNQFIDVFLRNKFEIESAEIQDVQKKQNI